MRYRWEAALVGICAIWGATFVVVQDAVERIPPFRYLAARFALGALVLVAFGALRGLTRREVRAGAVLGVALFAGYAFQTVGLQYTSASNAGFITGLFVILTPLAGIALTRARPSRGSMLGVALATAGLVLLAMPSGFRVRGGDALELGCALSFAIHIVLTGKLAPGLNAVRLTAMQAAVVAALSGAWTLAAEHGARGSFPWFAVIIGGVAATAVAFAVQTRAQQQISPTRTAVILSAEPVFAGIAGYLFAGDRLGARGYAGAALIVAGIVAVELLATREAGTGELPAAVRATDAAGRAKLSDEK
jgi:drug/metabolite transporter (DMT)-like permease